MGVAQPWWGKATAAAFQRQGCLEMCRREETWLEGSWDLEAGRIRLGTSYDVLPSPQNLCKWKGENQT